MTFQIPNAPNFAAKIATIFGRKKIHVTVITAACTIALNKDRSALETPGPAGISGTIITAATGATELEWEGELWALGLAANPSAPFCEFDIP